MNQILSRSDLKVRRKASVKRNTEFCSDPKPSSTWRPTGQSLSTRFASDLPRSQFQKYLTDLNNTTSHNPLKVPTIPIQLL